MSDEALMAVPSAKAGLEDMALLFDYLEVYGVLDKVHTVLPWSEPTSQSLSAGFLMFC